MKINRNNYEIFFVDYSDGKLSENQIENLMAFISLNPDLEEEFYTFINLEKLPENRHQTATMLRLDLSEINTKLFR